MTVGSVREHFQKIDEEICKVIVVHKSKTVWMAYGDFRDKPLNGSGRSESAALSAWIRKANNEANS